MADFGKIKKNKGKIEVIFPFFENDISRKIEDILDDEEGVATVCSWEKIVINHLAQTGQSDLLTGTEIDPCGRGDDFYTFFEDTPENEARAGKYVEAVRAMMNNEAEILRFVRDNFRS